MNETDNPLIDGEKTEAKEERPSDLERSCSALELIVGEGAVLEEAVGEGWVDTVLDWLGPQYAATMRLRLLEVDDEAGRLELLRGFLGDWNQLRQREQASERLEIARWRVECLQRLYWDKFNTDMDRGLDALVVHVKKNPQAWKAFQELASHLPRKSTYDPRGERVREMGDPAVFDPGI